MAAAELRHVWIEDHNGDLKMFPAQDTQVGWLDAIHEGPKCKLCGYNVCTGCEGADTLFDACPERAIPLFDLEGA